MISREAGPQEVFNYVAEKIREQGWPSADPVEGVCLLRGPQGRKCAIGWLIPDEDYKPGLELFLIVDLKDSVLDLPNISADFLCQLQNVHDFAWTGNGEVFNGPEEFLRRFEKELERMADENNLEYSSPNELGD